MNLLSVENAGFAYRSGRPILEDVSFGIASGETLGLLGESGSGKTTLLRLMLGLQRPQSGRVLFEGKDLAMADRASLRNFRRQVQIVFQDPYSSLDPRQRVGSIVREPLRSLRVEGDHRMMVSAVLEAVDLPADSESRYPHQFSGGQRQRIAIARAIVSRPRLLLADEAVSALDLTTRARIVALLRELSAAMALVFVSHDVGVVASLCRRVAVLERGRIVEAGETAEVLRAPRHPYTQRLLASVPRLKP